jgi:long-chain acyl-CoA synthetase
LTEPIFKIFNFEQYEDNIALITNEKELTYKDLNQLSNKIASTIESNSLVFLFCKNSIESVASYVGIIRKNCACALIADKINIHSQDLINLYNPKYLIIPKEELSTLENFQLLLELEEYVILKTKNSIDYKLDDKLRLLLTTSGSTGSPKFVKLSEKNIISNTNAISEYLNITESDRTITTLPMNYTYGLSILNTHLSNGASIILTNSSIISKDFWNLFQQFNANNFGGVPYTYEMLKKLNFKKLNLSSLKYLTQAGGKLSKNLILEFSEICKENGIDFFVMYGQTEATARMSYLPPNNLANKVGSIGISIPGGEFSLLDDKGIEIKEINKVGELIYKGENVFMGYALTSHDLEMNAPSEVLHTGDLALRDEDNYYYIVGRKNRFSKIFGNRINLDEIEEIIENIGIKCACTGDDEAITIHLEKEIDTNQLLNQILEYVNIHRTAFKFNIVNEIPRNSSGKVLYSKLHF